MDKKDIEALVDKKLTEAKLELSERRIHHILTIGGIFLAIFGFIAPWIFSIQSAKNVDSAVQQMKSDFKDFVAIQQTQLNASSQKLETAIQEMKQDQSQVANEMTLKTDKAIQEMRTQFKELAGTQLRKPVIECSVEGKLIENQILSFSEKKTEYVIGLKNVGDATAKNIKMLFYAKFENDIDLFYDYTPMSELSNFDEPSFTRVFEMEPFPDSLDPKGSNSFTLSVSIPQKRQARSLVLLKIFYEQPEPTRYQFTVALNQNES